MLIDSHAHLDDAQFDGDREATIRRALSNGIQKIVNIGADMDSSARSVALAEAYPEIYAAVGVHPHDAKTVQDGDYERLIAWTNHPKVVAVGEIGLDYYYDLSPRDVQKAVFVRQLDIARQTDMPIVIHNRDAHGDTMDILRREGKGLRGVVHCFSGSPEMAAELVKMGWYIGVDGPITFKNAAKALDVVRQVPLERLLVETDSPYLTPMPHRGKRNEPLYALLVAERVAEIRAMDVKDVIRATAQNTCDLFGIKE